MKAIIALFLCTACMGQSTKATQSDSAQVITTAGSTSLSPEETATLKRAIEEAQHAHAVADAADAHLQDVQHNIAANHTIVAPYQIVTDFSTTIEEIPAPAVDIWTKVADEGDVVLIKAGTTVRFGAPAGTVNTVTGLPTAKDYWSAPVTYSADTTLTVNTTNFSPDPIYGAVKELDMLGTAGGVTKK
jgi:hypothetical protein